MRTIVFFLTAFMVLAVISQVSAQESYRKKIETLKTLKEKVTEQEKEALRKEVEDINERLADEMISAQEAKTLKESAAKRRALNIEDRIAIIDNRIALLERNKGEVLQTNRDFSISDDGKGISIMVNDEPWRIFERREPKYDRRTYSDFVFAFGLNNAVIDGESLEDSPYKIGGSRFAELGWSWRTRVFENSNFMRFNYGFSFQFNGLKPKDNQYFAVNDGEVQLEEFEFDLSKSKFRMDNLVFPVHFEFGPSRYREREDRVRYYIDRKFRLGIGGYGGFNLGTRQKLKYTRDGEKVKDKLKRGYNTSSFVYGLSGYVGIGGVLIYAKYDLSPIFKDAAIEQHNISMGLRFDL